MTRNERILIRIGIGIFLFFLALYLALIGAGWPGSQEHQGRNLQARVFGAAGQERAVLKAVRPGEYPFSDWLEFCSQRHADRRLWSHFPGTAEYLAEGELHSILEALMAPEEAQLLKLFRDFLASPRVEFLEAIEPFMNVATPPPAMTQIVLLHHLARDQANDSLFDREWRAIREGVDKFPGEMWFKKRECGFLSYFGRFPELFQRVEDPRYGEVFNDNYKIEIYRKSRQFWRMIGPLLRAQYQNLEPMAVLGSFATAIGWGLFSILLLPRYFPRKTTIGLAMLALFMGALSGPVTLVVAVIQDELLGWSHSSHPFVQLAYYVAGVGLREELIKIMFFAPLLCFREVRESYGGLVFASFVGLGFAVEENVLYFHGGAAFLGRFITANFFHMGLTGLLGQALALFVACPKSEARGEELELVFLKVVVGHGLYDFFIVSHIAGSLGPILTLAIYIFLAQTYLRGLFANRDNRNENLRRAFVAAVAIVVGAGFLSAALAHGPYQGLFLILQGLGADFALLYMFFREF